MTKWQVMPILVGVVTVAAFVGLFVVRRSTHSDSLTAVRPTAVEAPTPAKEPAKIPEAADPGPTPKPKGAAPAKPPVGQGNSGLPPALAQLLKLNATQEEAIAKVMAEWNAKLAEINRITSDAMKTAPRENVAALLDDWRQKFMSLKGGRTDQLKRIFTEEQAATYRGYRDQQYQTWLDQKVTQYCGMAKNVLQASDEQINQIKPLVRSAYDDATSGGNLVPSDSQRKVVKQLLNQQMMGLLTPEQTQLLTQNERAFDRLW